MNGADLAAALAAQVGGVVHALRTDPRWPAFGVEIRPAGCAVLVRDHGHVLTISCGARSWHPTPNDPMPPDLAAEARAWADSNPTVTTLADAARMLLPFLESETRDRWTLDIPGGQPIPSEMWLHGSDFDRASVGIFASAIRNGADRSVPMPPSRNLVETCKAVLGFVRDQSAAYDRHVALTRECERMASEMATPGKRWRVIGRPNWFAAGSTAVYEGEREIARIEAKDGAVTVTRFEAGAVTFESLREGARYRVKMAFDTLEKGEIVTYLGQPDNHAPLEFRRANGEIVSVSEGWLQTRAQDYLSVA